MRGTQVKGNPEVEARGPRSPKFGFSEISYSWEPNLETLSLARLPPSSQSTRSRSL